MQSIHGITGFENRGAWEGSLTLCLNIWRGAKFQKVIGF